MATPWLNAAGLLFLAIMLDDVPVVADNDIPSRAPLK